ncbi:MAG: hypothetical protein ACK5WP_09650 [Neisseriaceae bacterium]
MRITKYAILLTTLLVGLIGLSACGSGGAGGGSLNGNNVPQPGNLVSDTKSITNSGVKIVNIKNTGQSPVTINGGSLHTNNTVDKVVAAKTDCYSSDGNRTLDLNQVCKVALDIAPGEAGISEIKLNSNNGTYTFPINVDTVGEGVLDTDIKEIRTTKLQTINVINRGAVALTIESFSVESTNNTLKVNNISCVNNQLDAGKECQISVQAAPGQNKMDILKVQTNSTFLKTQILKLNEKTNINKLSIESNAQLESNNVSFDKPGSYQFSIQNTGTNDIHVSNLYVASSNIGTVTSSCNGIKLQAGDTCDFRMNVKNNAYGGTNLLVNTTESLDSGFDYSMQVSGGDLRIDDANDVVIHTNATKNVIIKNSGAFAVDLDSITYNSATMKFSSNCSGTILAGGQCSGTIVGLNTPTDDNNLTFNEFGGKVKKTINVHITNGVASGYQPQGNAYYAPLPQDGNFYQVFTVVNNSNMEQSIDLMNRDSGAVTIMTTGSGGNSLPSSAYLNPNCIVDNNISNVAVTANSTCEIILREPNNLSILQQIINDGSNSDRGNFRIQVVYKDTHDTFINKYQGIVSTKNMHRDPTYPAGAKIAANQSISVNSCGIQNAAGTLILNNPAQPRSDPSSEGFVINADFVGDNTISITGFFGWPSMCTGKSDIPWKLQDQYGSDTEIGRYNDSDGSNTWIVYALAGSSCVNNKCSINFALNQITGGRDIGTIGRRSISFDKPLPAADWTIATGVTWQNLGALTIKAKRN